MTPAGEVAHEAEDDLPLPTRVAAVDAPELPVELAHGMKDVPFVYTGPKQE